MTEQRPADVDQPARSVRGVGRSAAVVTAGVRARLRADCGRCAGLCCVAPGFTRSADFPLSKAPGVACGHLSATFTCAVHDELRTRGFHGCVVFDCAGAGQQVTQITFAGRDWRNHPADAARMFDVFAIMRILHESLRHLTEALTRLDLSPGADGELVDALGALWRETVTLTDADADTLLALDVSAHRRAVHAVLSRAGTHLRARPSAPAAADEKTARLPGGRAAGSGSGRASRRGRGGGRARRAMPMGVVAADLVGAGLAGADLRGAELTGRLLLGADLRRADLRGADLRGADLRGADLGGADLRGALFLTQSQLDSARGDAATILPDERSRPAHWQTKR